MEYTTVKKIAERWGIPAYRVSQLCREGCIPGAVRGEKTWSIPLDAKRPERVGPTDTCSASKMAKEWGISPHIVVRLCKEGRIPGAVRNGRDWYIPTDAVSPLQGYMTAPQAAEKWGVEGALVCKFCKEGRIPCAVFKNQAWYIPADAEKPVNKATERKSGYISVEETAAKWGVAYSTACAAAREGRIAGAELIGGKWHIPADAQRPMNKAVVRKSGYISAKKTAEKWGLTPSAVCAAAKAGRIPGAGHIDGKWHIPEDAKMPANKRMERKAGFISVTKAAEKWESTRSFVCKLCREGRISGAEWHDGKWHIPQDAVFPVKRREKKKKR